MADALRREDREAILAVSAAERIAFALKLGERDLESFRRAAGAGLSRDETVRELERRRQAGPRATCTSSSPRTTRSPASFVRAAAARPSTSSSAELPGSDSWPFRALPAEVDGVPVPVDRPADLVLLKLYAGGPQDAWDIDQLLASADARDVAREVESRIGELPEDARALWRRVNRLRP